MAMWACLGRPSLSFSFDAHQITICSHHLPSAPTSTTSLTVKSIPPSRFGHLQVANLSFTKVTCCTQVPDLNALLALPDLTMVNVLNCANFYAASAVTAEQIRRSRLKRQGYVDSTKRFGAGPGSDGRANGNGAVSNEVPAGDHASWVMRELEKLQAKLGSGQLASGTGLWCSAH